MDQAKGGFRVVAAVASATLLAFGLTACSVAPGSLDRAGGQKTVAPTALIMAAPAGIDEIGAYVDSVARLSDGTVQIEPLSRARTEDLVGLNGADIIDAVRTGDLPLALLPAREFGALGISSLDALQAPFAVDSLKMEADLLRDADITAPMLDEIGSLGVEAVAILPGPLVHPLGITAPLLAPSDFEGATIAVGTGDVAARTLRLLGARPVESAFNGAAVEDFDGALLQLPAVIGNAYHSPGRSVTSDVTLWPRPLVIVANSESFAALTEAQRAALRDAATASMGGVVKTNAALDAEAARIGCGAGLSLPVAGAANLDELRAEVRPLIDEIAATDIGAAVFARVDELRESEPVPKHLVCLAAPADWPTEVSNRLDGTYIADTTADDLRAQGVSERDVVDENWGHWVLVVKDGRFAFTQESELACTWVYGAWRMGDDLVRMTWEGGGGIAPHGTNGMPGEDYVYHWTDFASTLKLTLAMDDGPPDQAYTRVSDVPDVAAFPKRCAPPAAAFATD